MILTDFQMLRLDTIEHIRTFSSPDPVVVRFPKVATFSEDGAVLIGGTDKGHAMVFDVQSGAKVQPLKYAKGGLVQPVAACISNKGFLAAIAGSTMEIPAEVVIYQKSHLPPSTPESNDIIKESLYRTLMHRGTLQFIFVILGMSLMLNGLYFLALNYAPMVQSMLEAQSSMSGSPGTIKVHTESAPTYSRRDPISISDAYTIIESRYASEHLDVLD